MDLLILLFIFALLGYILGTSRAETNADRATEKASLTSKNLLERLGERWNALTNPRGFSVRFRDWATQDAPELFPDEFKDWLTGLNSAQLNEFVKALNTFSRSSGYSLSALVRGELDEDPRMRQVFVEAISVYSQAYRKAREANNKNTSKVEKEENPKAQEPDMKPQAEKAPSRRKASNHNDSIEPAASTD